MSISCPNKRLKVWKDLVQQVGENKAYLLWAEYDGNVPDKYYQKEIKSQKEGEDIKRDLSQFESEENESIFDEKIIKENKTVVNNNTNFDTNKNVLFGKEDINKSFTAQEVLKNIIDSDVELSKAGTELIVKAMNVFKNANTRVKIISQKRFDELTKGSEGEGTAVMAYNYDLGNNIYIPEKSLKLFSPEQIIESFIHEIAHNISIKALVNPETFEEHQFNDLIKKAFEQYKYLGKTLNGSGSYGFTNEKEFVAELYSNAKFQEEIKRLDRTLWRRIKDELRRLLGLPKSLINDELIDSILLINTVETFIETNENVPSALFKNDYSKSFNNTDFKIIKESESYNLTSIDKKLDNLLAKTKDKITQLINRTKKSKKEGSEKYLESFKELQNQLDTLSEVNKWKAISSYIESFYKTLYSLNDTLDKKFQYKSVEYNGATYNKVATQEAFWNKQLNQYVIPADQESKFDADFIKNNNVIVDSELYNNIENEAIKSFSERDYLDVAFQTEEYLHAYDLLDEVKQLISDTEKDSTLSRQDKLEIKELKHKILFVAKPHDEIITKIKQLKKDSVIKLLSDPSNNKKVLIKWKKKLELEYNKLDKPIESKDEWIGYQMSNVYSEQIARDLEEDALKIVNNPYMDITSFTKNWSDLLNTNSPLINAMSNIIGKMRDSIIKQINDISFVFDKQFKEYSKFNDSASMSKKYGNLVELNENNDRYYLKGKYSIKFKQEYDKMYNSVKEKYKEEGDKLKVKSKPEYKEWLKNNTIVINEGELLQERVPADKYLNKGLSKEELKVLEFFQKQTKENQDKKYNGRGSLVTSLYGAEFYKLPSKTKSAKERTLEGDIKGQVKDQWTDLTTTKVDDINYGEAFDSQGNELKRIKINFRGKISSKDQSLDLFTVYRAEQINAITFRERSNHENKLKLFLDIAKDKQYKKKSLLDGKWAKNIYSKDDIKGQTFLGEFSEEVKKIKGILETALYDVTSYNEQKIFGIADANKLTNKVNSITATLGMTLNLGSSTVNMLNGQVMMMMERFGSKYITKSNLAKAEANYTKNLPNILADFNNPVKKSFHNQMLNMFDVIGGYNISKQDFLNNSTIKEALSSHNLNFMNDSVEHMLNSVLTESILRSIPVMNKDYKYIDKNGNETTKDKAASIFDMLYLDENGVLKTKEYFKYSEYNLVDDYHNTGKQSINFLIKKQVFNLYGVYDANFKPEISKLWYGKLVLMFKNFFISQAQYRYKGLATANKSKDELDDEDLNFNNAEQEFTEGTYVTVIRTFFPLLKGLNVAMVKENLKNLSDYEKANLKKAFLEIGLTAVILPLLGAILAASAGDDDDELYFLLYCFRRLESELSQFRNPAELNRMITNPIAANRFLQNSFQVINDIFTPINFTPKDNESYFDWLSEDSKGNNKLLKDVFKLAPGKSLFMNTYEERYNLINK